MAVVVTVFANTSPNVKATFLNFNKTVFITLLLFSFFIFSSFYGVEMPGGKQTSGETASQIAASVGYGLNLMLQIGMQIYNYVTPNTNQYTSDCRRLKSKKNILTY